MLAVGKSKEEKRIEEVVSTIIKYRKAKKIGKLVLVSRNLREEVETKKPTLAAVLSFF